MSRPMRSNSEGFSSRPSEMAWGCLPSKGWVPMPPKIPRRHPLLDSVGRIDDPCDRPRYGPPDWKPMPSFKPPREGYPNDMCNPEDYAENKGSEQFPEASAYMNIARGTPQTLHVKLPPVVNCSGQDPKPTIEECCTSTRALDVVEEKYKEIVQGGRGGNGEGGSGGGEDENGDGEEDGENLQGDVCEGDEGEDGKKRKMVAGPQEEREAGTSIKYRKCMTICSPLLRAYPCRGVIDELPDESVWMRPKGPGEKCRKKGEEAGQCGRCSSKDVKAVSPDDWKKQAPVSGWEFIDKCRTCDYYPIQKNLMERFNNPAWFKGYGCERPAHPFYVTTSSDVGRFGPNPHTMTQMYFPRSGAFTELLAITGMYRNRTLNTANNKECIRKSLCC